MKMIVKSFFIALLIVFFIVQSGSITTAQQWSISEVPNITLGGVQNYIKISQTDKNVIVYSTGYGQAPNSHISLYHYRMNSLPTQIVSGDDIQNIMFFDINQDATKVVFIGKPNGEANYKIYYTEYSGGSWSSPLVIADAGTGHGVNKLAISATGDKVVYVKYCYNLGYEDQLYLVEYSGGSWQTPERLDNNEVSESGIDISNDGNRVFFIAPTVPGDFHFSLYVMTYSDGSWSSPTLLGSHVSDVNSTISEDGTKVLLIDYDYTLYYKYYSEGNWSNPIDAGFNANSYSVAINGNTIVNYQYPYIYRYIWYNNQWSLVQQIRRNYCSQITLSADGSRAVFMGGSNKMYYLDDPSVPSASTLSLIILVALLTMTMIIIKKGKILVNF